MTDTNEEPFFKCLDNNTMFTAAQAYMYENDAGLRSMRNIVGTWLWEDVRSVQTVDEQTFPEMEGPRCVVFVSGGDLFLRADYQTVLTAWRKYRKRYNDTRLTFTTSN